jgi:hypothetical protein
MQALFVSGAAQESNLPSLGLPDLTGFEDRLGRVVKFWSSSDDERWRTVAKRKREIPRRKREWRPTAIGSDGCRRNRTQEVAGSSPASSTLKRPVNASLWFPHRDRKIGRNRLVVRFWSSGSPTVTRPVREAWPGRAQPRRAPARLRRPGAPPPRSAHREQSPEPRPPPLSPRQDAVEA